MLRQPVDLKIGVEVPQLIGNRDVAPRVPKANRGGDVKRAAAAGLGARPSRGGSPPLHELADQEVDPHRISRQGNVPRAMERDHIPAGRSGRRLALNVRAAQVAVAVDHEWGAPPPRARLSEQLLPGDSGPEDRVQDRLWRSLKRPADAIFDLLGRMRLVETTAEEELQEAHVIALQEAGSLDPLRVGLDRVFER